MSHPIPEHQLERFEEFRALKQAATCEVCGGEAIAEHCKVICFRCGFRRTCSDTV